MELEQTRRYSEGFRQQLLTLDVEEMMNADKAHFFFGDEADRARETLSTNMESTNDDDGRDSLPALDKTSLN